MYASLFQLATFGASYVEHRKTAKMFIPFVL
jgi:hypothetical protein